jgi:hypothetical protein
LIGVVRNKLSVGDRDSGDNLINSSYYDDSDNDNVTSTDSEPINPRFRSLDNIYLASMCESLGLPELSVNKYAMDSHAYNILSTQPRV